MYSGSDVAIKASVVETLDTVLAILKSDGLQKGTEKIKADRDAMKAELSKNQYELVLTLKGEEIRRMDILAKSEIAVEDIARNSAKVFSNFATKMTTMKWTTTESGFIRDYGDLTKMELIRKS